MKSLSRSGLLCLVLAAPMGHAAAPDTSLLGCWRAVKIVLHAQDGSTTEDSSGRCMLRFEEDRFESTCATSTGTSTTIYQYQLVRPNVYLATMIGSTFRTSLIGSAREYEYRVDGGRLVTVAAAKAATPTSPAATPRVETESSRTACS